MPAHLTLHDRTITTPFGLLGTNENALTYALGFTLRQCPALLAPILKAIGVTGWRTAWSNEMSIEGQRHRNDGITDLEIHVPGRLMLVIEAKVGMSVPTLAQCRRYLDRFAERPAPIERLVMLTETTADHALSHYASQEPSLAGRLGALTWPELLPMCTRLLRSSAIDDEARRWLVAFRRFLDEEYQMKCHTDEVWIVPASRKPLWPGGLSFFDTHTIVERPIYYRHDQELKRPLYIALRTEGAVRTIQRVEGVDFDACPVDYVPELANVKDEDWPTRPHTIWRIGPPVNLPHEIPTGDSNMRSRQCNCDLDVLLTAPTVREIEVRMKERRTG